MGKIYYSYPIFKVAILYAFLGSVIGGALVGFSALFSVPIMMISFIILGLIFGFIPALLTGIMVAILQLTKDKPKDYVIMAVIGGIISFIFILILSFFDKNAEFSNMPKLSNPFVIIRAISSMITGAIVLPRQSDLEFL